MLRYLGRISLVLLVVSLAAAPLAAEKITPKDIDRSYGFTCSGTVSGAPATLIGQVTCDSKTSSCSATFYQNPAGTEISFTASGPFTLDKNGVGFVTYDVGPGFFTLPIRFVVVDNGREIMGMPILPGYNVLCDLKAQ